MRRLSWAALIMLEWACSRGNLQVINPPAVADASDTRAALPDASDTRVVTPDVSDTRAVTPDANDTRAVTPDASDTNPVVICPSPAAKSGNSTLTLPSGRSYVLHIPSSYDGSKPVPLILDFHLNFGSGSAESKTSPYPDLTDREGVIMAFPSGLVGAAGASWNVGPCCVAKADDFTFTQDMIKDIQKTLCIDEKRIYAVGTYAGGGMAYAFACRAADTFAAVSAVQWDLLKENVDDCKPSRPITVVSFRATADSLVPYAGGESRFVPDMPINFLGAQKSFQKWAEINNCAGEPSKPDSNGCSRYSACRDGVEVVLCTVQGGSPSGDPSIAWPLFKQHPKP